MMSVVTPTEIRDVRFHMSRRLLVTLLSFYGIPSLFLFGVAVHLGASKTMMLAGCNTLVAILSYFLHRRGMLEVPGVLVTFGVLATGFYATWSSPRGIEDASIIILSASSVMSAMLLRTRFFVLQLVAVVAGTLALGFRESFGVTGGPTAVRAPAMDVFLLATVLLAITLGLRRFNNDLWAILGRAVDNENRLRDNHQALLDQTRLAGESEQRWRSLVDAMPDHVLQLDAAGTIIFCNHEDSACARSLGQPLTNMVVARDRADLAAAVHGTLERGRPGRVECESSLGDKPKTFIFTLGPLKDGEGRPGAIVLVSDVTERNRLREQLLRSQKLDSLGRLAGGIAHDFNNLLTVISGHAELAEMKVDQDSPLGEDLKVIRQTGDRAAELTQQILAFGRRQSLRLSPLRLDEVLTAMERMLSPLIGTDIRLQVDPDPGLPAIMADRSQLEQLVTNLVLNARDAIKAHDEPNARKIRLSTRLVKVDARMLDELLGLEPGEHVELMVSDTGTGMTPEVQQRLFEPFFTTKKSGEGTGLGLATVYGIVHQTRGAIRVYSELGLGTSIKVYWPVAKNESDSGSSLGDGMSDAEIGGTENILLVEDDPAVLKLARTALEGLGYAVLAAENGEEALALIGAGKSVDIVVSDVVMPGINGFELAKKIPAGMPIILTSGYAEDTWISSGHAVTRGQFLQKPYGPADLAAMIRRQLNHSPRT